MLFGLEGDDTFIGGSGDDTITGGAGDDAIDGGEGKDSAVWNANAANYTLTFYGQQLVVHDTVGSDGSDLLANLETLQFADKSVIVQTGTPAWSYYGLPEELYHFFIVAFGAASGVTYMDQLAEAYDWFTVHQPVANPVKTIVDIFVTKHQFTELYPDRTDLQVRANPVEDIVKTSASVRAKAEAVADIGAALGIGWTVGDVIYTSDVSVTWAIITLIGQAPTSGDQWPSTCRGQASASYQASDASFFRWSQFGVTITARDETPEATRRTSWR